MLAMMSRNKPLLSWRKAGRKNPVSALLHHAYGYDSLVETFKYTTLSPSDAGLWCDAPEIAQLRDWMIENALYNEMRILEQQSTTGEKWDIWRYGK